MSNARFSPARLIPMACALAGAMVLTLAIPATVSAQASTATPAAAKPAAKSAAKSDATSSTPRKSSRQNTARKAAPAPEPEPTIGAADDAQMSAQREVMLGASACEFGQRINVDPSDKHPGYVDLSFNNRRFLMKPVLSSTGALRLEDVRAETLLIQIGNKTMLMNQKTGQRLVDNCIHPKHQTVAATGSGNMLGIEAPK